MSPARRVLPEGRRLYSFLVASPWHPETPYLCTVSAALLCAPVIAGGTEAVPGVPAVPASGV